MTKTLLTVVSLSILSATLAFAQQQVSNKGKSATLTGVVSDSMCGASHMSKDKSAADCTRECAKAGSDYALVVDSKVYALKGDKTEIDKYAGQRATVKGSVDGTNISVQSIAAAH